MSVNDDAEFKEFEAAGTVEVGEANLASQKDEKPEEKPAAKRGPPKPAPAPAEKPEAKEGDEEEDDKGKGEEEEQEELEEEDEEEEDEKPEKAKRKPSDRIRELTRRNREKDRLLDSMATRLEALEKGGLPNRQSGDKSATQELPAPDPSDTAKYPLGHLDDRYIEDKLEWLADKKAANQADAALHRQQEIEQNAAAQREQQALLDKVDDLSARGDELYDDFQESVVETGMKGKWDLSQATFEACAESDNGAQILYELSQDKKEASRVARLSNYQQMKFVQERDAAIGAGKKPRLIPKAGEPAKNIARGANSKTQINPATDNLSDFEKAWARDEKASSQ